MPCDEIGALMKFTTRLVEQTLNERANSLGLTSAQMHILHVICDHNGALHAKELERHFDLSHATVSGILLRLESKGFLTLREDQSDRRAKCLFATEKAMECTDAMRREIGQCEKRMLTGFSEEERRALRQYLLRILANLDAPAPGICIRQEDKA